MNKGGDSWMDTFKKIMKEWVIPFGLEILAVLLIVKYVFFFAVVPTGSMLPTVSEHSLLFSTRMYNPEKNVKRGDILVFYSDELEETLLNRCIGLPGEHVVIDSNGQVTIDGVPLDEPYVVYKNGDTGNFVVPEGCFLFLGDNRNGSLDARYWDNPYISGDQIKGKAHFTIWPFDNFGPLK